MKKLLYLSLIALIVSSCSYTVYDMAKGPLDIPQKTTYSVNYMTDIPKGTSAMISYMDKDNTRHVFESYSGRFDKTIELPSGQDIKFTVDVKLPKTEPKSVLHTTVKVDGQTITDQTQGGKKVLFRFAFKLP